MISQQLERRYMRRVEKKYNSEYFIWMVRFFSNYTFYISGFNYFLWKKKYSGNTFNSFYGNFLLSLNHVMVEKILLLGQIFEMDISVDLHVLRTAESKNQIFSG